MTEIMSPTYAELLAAIKSRVRTAQYAALKDMRAGRDFKEIKL